MGAADTLKYTGLVLWSAWGPWAPRRPATIYYSLRYLDCMPLSVGWDWAAKSLELPAPASLIRSVPRGELVVIPTGAMEKLDKAATLRNLLNTPAPQEEKDKTAKPSNWPDTPAPCAPPSHVPLTPNQAGFLNLDSPLPGVGSSLPPSPSPTVDRQPSIAPRGGHRVPVPPSPDMGCTSPAAFPVKTDNTWCGPCRPRPRPEDTPVDNKWDSPGQPLSWSLKWTNRENWKS